MKTLSKLRDFLQLDGPLIFALSYLLQRVDTEQDKQFNPPYQAQFSQNHCNELYRPPSAVAVTVGRTA